jgi:tRNA A-37 threonylcarbamoyl transferase component Bud32
VPGYEVLEELGRGGMGVVYKARQLRPRRLVALKMILAGDHAGADALARFNAEAESIARLRHPNIVQVHEVGEHAGRPYLTLEFIEGGSLAQRLADKRPSSREAAELLLPLARAVHFAHGKGVVHRDLKPANVLLAEDGAPKIADFGLAKQLDAMTSVAPVGPRTQSGAILGTPSYMAPEQAGGKSKDIGPAADVYSLGAILYEMLTGRPPFQGETVLDTLMKVASEEPVPPRQLRPKVPVDLETICRKCLQKAPADRYASAGGLADDLERFLGGEPIHARPPRARARTGRWLLRKRRADLAVGGGLVAFAGLALLVLALFWAWGLGGGGGEGLPKPVPAEASDGNPTVEGRVTYNGRPLTAGLVTFIPSPRQMKVEDGTEDRPRPIPGHGPVRAVIGPDGSYSLQLKSGPGHYRVTVQSEPEQGPALAPDAMKMVGPDARKEAVVPVPPMYANPETSPLTREVRAGRQTIDLVLID